MHEHVFLCDVVEALFGFCFGCLVHGILLSNLSFKGKYNVYLDQLFSTWEATLVTTFGLLVFC